MRDGLFGINRLKQVVNLGIGTPEVIAEVAKEENQIDKLILTTEAGVHGGLPSGDLVLELVNTDAIISQNQQFDFYDGGGIHCFSGNGTN